MSYHRAVILPNVQPMRRFASAQSVWARQLHYAVPKQQPPPAVPAGRAVLGGLRRMLGDSGDGLGRGLGSALVVL